MMAKRMSESARLTMIDDIIAYFRDKLDRVVEQARLAQQAGDVMEAQRWKNIADITLREIDAWETAKANKPLPGGGMMATREWEWVCRTCNEPIRNAEIHKTNHKRRGDPEPQIDLVRG